MLFSRLFLAMCITVLIEPTFQSEKELETIPTDERTWSVDWHPNTKLIASVGGNKTITLWK